MDYYNIHKTPYYVYNNLTTLKKNVPKNYLSDTISSINKKTVKYDKIVNKPLENIILSNVMKPISKINLVLPQQQKLVISDSSFWGENNSISIYDKYNHFNSLTTTTDFGNDPYGHFD
jgi:hypothetical protein